MSLGLLGKKLGMTQIYNSHGDRVAVTIIESADCCVTQIRSKQVDGYTAVQLGYDEKPGNRLNKAAAGHFKKAGVSGRRFLSEIRVAEQAVDAVEAGQSVNVAQFVAGDSLDITGISKGRGFAGVIKRHGFSGASATHGTHEYFRHGGSIGCAFPQHTIKGVKMPGRYGGKRKTIQNLRVIAVQADRNLLFVGGNVPGKRGGYLLLRKAIKSKI